MDDVPPPPPAAGHDAPAPARDPLRGTASLADVPLRWVLVAPDEVGVLHRLGRVVRGTPGGVLVRLDALPPAASGAQVGISPRACCGGHPADLVWLGGLSASDVGVVEAWVASGSPRVPPELAARVVTTTRATTTAARAGADGDA